MPENELQVVASHIAKAPAVDLAAVFDDLGVAYEERPIILASPAGSNAMVMPSRSSSTRTRGRLGAASRPRMS